MFGSRRGRPSLSGAAARTAGRTAVIVGTANAMSRPRGEAASAHEATPMPAAAAPPAGLTAESIEKLKELAALQAAGILTEAEFTEQKTRILAG